MHSVTMVTVKTTSLQGQNFIILNEQVRQTVWDVILAVCHYDQLKKKGLFQLRTLPQPCSRGHAMHTHLYFFLVHFCL